jgi:hypothetical protein
MSVKIRAVLFGSLFWIVAAFLPYEPLVFDVPLTPGQILAFLGAGLLAVAATKAWWDWWMQFRRDTQDDRHSPSDPP